MTLTARNKAALRQTMRAARGALTPDAARRAGLAGLSLLRGQPFWEKAGEVLGYLPVRGEFDARPLIEDLWARGRRVLLPRCRDGEDGRLDLAPVTCLAEVAPGRHGIPEPCPEACLPPGDFSPDLILAPGLAFDRSGGRMGHGGGYYDRLLADPAMGRAVIVGLAYDFQVVPNVPADPWDRPMDALLTEKEFLWIRAWR